MRPEKIEDEVVRLARSLPRVKLADSERTKRAILEAIEARRPEPTRSFMPLAIAAAVLIAILIPRMPPEAPPPPKERSRAAIKVVRSARFESRRPQQGREVVRLDDGRVRFDVEKLAGGERFVVQAGDGEVEVRGTSFDVDVSQGILREVIVHEGAVAVRHGGVEILLAAGERWPPIEKEALPPKPKPKPMAPRKAVAERNDFQTGWEAMRTGDGARASEAFERAGDGPLAEDAAFWRAVALAKSRDPEAKEAFRSFLERFPESPRSPEASMILQRLETTGQDIR